jgi:hypothetical protein
LGLEDRRLVSEAVEGVLVFTMAALQVGWTRKLYVESSPTQRPIHVFIGRRVMWEDMRRNAGEENYMGIWSVD